MCRRASSHQPDPFQTRRRRHQRALAPCAEKQRESLHLVRRPPLHACFPGAPRAIPVDSLIYRKGFTEKLVEYVHACARGGERACLRPRCARRRTRPRKSRALRPPVGDLCLNFQKTGPTRALWRQCAGSAPCRRRKVSSSGRLRTLHSPQVAVSGSPSPSIPVLSTINISVIGLCGTVPCRRGPLRLAAAFGIASKSAAALSQYSLTNHCLTSFLPISCLTNYHNLLLMCHFCPYGGGSQHLLHMGPKTPKCLGPGEA